MSNNILAGLDFDITSEDSNLTPSVVQENLAQLQALLDEEGETNKGTLLTYMNTISKEFAKDPEFLYMLDEEEVATYFRSLETVKGVYLGEVVTSKARTSKRATTKKAKNDLMALADKLPEGGLK